MADKGIPPLSTSSLLTGLIVVAVFFSLMGGFYTINAGDRGIVLRMGAIHGQAVEPGLHFKVPMVDHVIKMTARVQKYERQETAASKDLQDVKTTVVTNFHLDPAKVSEIYTTLGDNEALVMKVLSPAIANAVKAVTARYNAEDLVAKRDQVRQDIESAITQDTQKYFVAVDQVNITDFSFSPEYTRAIEAKQVAQQRSLQAKYELDKVQVDVQQQVLKAKAAADATVVAAKADAEALQLKGKFLTPNLIRLEAVNKWDGKLPVTMAGGGAVPFLNISANDSKQ